MASSNGGTSNSDSSRSGSAGRSMVSLMSVANEVSIVNHDPATTICTERRQSRVSKETMRTAAVDATATVVTPEIEEGATERASPANVEIALPSLTRLDLNNNILHDLDDLKVRGEQ